MAFWNSKNQLFLNGDDEEWQLETWQYLIENLNIEGWFDRGPIILPNDDFFPPTSKKGAEKAAYVFDQVTLLAGLDEWPFVLEEQKVGLSPVLGAHAIVKDAPNDPLGTFQYDSKEDKITITYAPELVDSPAELIATFAHEISHALVASIHEEPPGGWENEEFVTDLTVAFLGFGIFPANTAFQFSQSVDHGSGAHGWSYKRSGYLTELEWCFSLAVFLKLKSCDFNTIKPYLKSSVAASVGKALKYLDKNPLLIANFG